MRNKVLARNGIQMNKSKTRVVLAWPKKQELNVTLDEERIEQESLFQYLDPRGKCETRIRDKQ